WFRDYMYIPLGGSQGGVGMKIRNTFIIFLVSGFWHGANWTFLVWGGLNALYFIPLMLAKTNRNHLDTVASGKIFPNAREFLLIISTFCLTVVAWIFFRAPSVMEALDYLSRMFSWGLFAMPEIWPYKALFCVVVLVIVEWLQRDKQHGLEFENIHIPKLTRYLIYYSIILDIFLIGGMQEQFIYFQF
ncbi:MAG: MBOAT family O-acyltransferase, partial [Bacteroidota bacterium]